MVPHNEQPSFRTLRLRHNISLGGLMRATPTVAPDDIIVFDQVGKAETYVVDLLLASLSRLSGTCYTRADIGNITFLLSADHEMNKLTQEPPTQPTLSQLRHYYDLSVYKVSQATEIDPKTIYFMFLGQPAPRQNAEAVLDVISRFTGTGYTLQNTRIPLVEELVTN